MFALLFMLISAIALVLAFEHEANRSRPIVRRFNLGTLGATSMILGCAFAATFLTNVSHAYADNVIDSVVVEDDAENTEPPITEDTKKSVPTPAAVVNSPATEVAVKVVPDVATETPARDLNLLADEIAAHVHVPTGRPAWVESDRIFHGEGGDQTAVSSGPHALKHDATEVLEEQLNVALREYVNEYLRNENAAVLVGYHNRDMSFFESHLIKNRYDEVIQVSFGPMHQRHALVEFDDDFRAELNDKWNRLQATTRLSTTGLAAFAVIGLIGVLFGYLRVDRATRGYYTGRLQLFTAVAILTLVGLAVMVANRFVPWM